MAPKQKPKTTSSATSQPSKSSEIVASNDDLLKQILAKLPLKPLMRFTSVSKHWLSLISGPDFSHRRKPPCCVSGLFIESPLDITEFQFVDLSQTSNPSYPPSESITFFNNSSQVKIIQSCNGLLLCSTNEEKPKEYYVDNPTTRKYAILPRLPFRYRSVWGMSLAFDPSTSPHYKVVCVLSQTIDDYHDDRAIGVDDTQIVIYSSETQTWRLSGDSFYTLDTNIFSKGVFWNGSLHWYDVFEYLYFNVDQERLGKVPLPTDTEPDVEYFVESGGHLYLIYLLLRGAALPGFNIYEMEMDYSDWFLRFQVDLSEFPTRFADTLPRKLDHKPEFLGDYFFQIVHIVRGDDDEESYAVLKIPAMVIKYNFKSKEFHKLCEIEAGKGETDCIVEWGDAHQYIESLALV